MFAGGIIPQKGEIIQVDLIFLRRYGNIVLLSRTLICKAFVRFVGLAQAEFAFCAFTSVDTLFYHT